MNICISPEVISAKMWRYFHSAGFIATDFMRLNSDGHIRGYNHDNERYWDIKDGNVRFFNQERKISVIFDQISYENGRILLAGRFLGDDTLTMYLREQEASIVDRLKNNNTKDSLRYEIENMGWSIGDHTYGVPHFIEKGMSKLVIGKYCSIAGHVDIAFGNHKTNFGTTYPFKSLERFWKHCPVDIEDHTSKGDVVIGSDVWIGAGALILSGVNIGHGAVIGAKSVITKDIPPYGIVAGNPGRIVRYRFQPDTISELLKLSWWDLDDEEVDEMIPFLMSDDTETLIKELQHIREKRYRA